MVNERSTRSQSRGSEHSGGERDRATPETPTPQRRGGIMRTPPATGAAEPTTAMKGKQKVVETPTDTLSESEATIEDTETPSETGEPSQQTEKKQKTARGPQLVYLKRKPWNQKGRQRIMVIDDDEESEWPEEEDEEDDTEDREMTVKELMERMTHIGSKMNVKLTGMEDYTRWEKELKRTVEGLGATAALEGKKSAVKSSQLWKTMDIVVSNIIRESVAPAMKIELLDDTAAEAVKRLRERYAKSGVSAYCTVAQKWLGLRQGQLTIQEYISKFDSIGTQFESAACKMPLQFKMGMFVAGLDQSLVSEAYAELNRQKEDADMEALRGTLIRHAAFEKSRREIRGSRSSTGPAAAQNFQQQREGHRGGPRGSNNSYIAPHLYTGAICQKCQGQHRTDNCGAQQRNQPSRGGRGMRGGYGGASGNTTHGAYSVQRDAANGYSPWLLDSAASSHLSKERPARFVKERRGERFKAANGEYLLTRGRGQVELGPLKMKDVRFVPGLDMNLMSVGAFDDDGWTILIGKGQAVLTKGERKLVVKKKEGIYPVTQELVDSLAAAIVKAPVLPEPASALKDTASANLLPKKAVKSISRVKWLQESLLHRRMGHLNREFVRMLPQAARQEFQIKFEKQTLCETCVLSKHKKKANREPVERAERPGQRIHVDLCGGGYTLATRDMQKTVGFEELPASEGGARYFIVMTDDFSRYRKTVTVKKKNDAMVAIREFMAEIEAKGYKIEAIRKDGGTEFGSKAFERWLRGKGVKCEDSAPYTPEQNGLSERSVGLICEKARSMMLATDLPLSLWAEAVLTATYLINRSPTRSLNRGVTPYEAFHGHKPSILHVRVFGCVAYGKIPVQKVHGKLMPRSRKMRLVGYESSNIYRLWNPVDRRITLTRDVVFDEGELGVVEKPAGPMEERVEGEKGEEVEERGEEEEKEEKAENETLSDIAREALGLMNFGMIDEVAPIAASVRRIGSRDPGPTCPRSYTQAKRSVASKEWQAAMEKQMEALTSNETWRVVERETVPRGANVLSGKWVYNEKEQENGEKIKKARWVVRGFEQREEDIDWDDLTAATVRAQTTRILFALAAAERWDVQQMDAVAAFLNGEIKEEVFVEMPMGWKQQGKVCKLQKTLYGLKTSPAIWYGLQASFLQSLGFEQSRYDPALFSKRGPGGVVFVSSHVDDYLMTGSDRQGVQELKSAMAGRFKMKDMGAAVSYLGMEIEKKEGAIELRQAKYTTQLLKETGMWEVKQKSTPMEAGLELQAVAENKAVRQGDYRKLVGKIQWLAVVTRPDISYAVSRLASVAQGPTEEAWGALKRLLRYLRGTVDRGLRFGGKEELRGYSDANWAEGESAKATTGIIFMMNGGPIHWFSRRQNIVALSTCEAEYIGAATATQDAAWIGPHVREMMGEKEAPVPIMVDNQGAIALAKKEGWNRRTRHINVRYQYVQDAVKGRMIRMEYVTTGDQLADGLTKALKPELFERWKGQLGVYERSVRGIVRDRVRNGRGTVSSEGNGEPRGQWRRDGGAE